GRVAHLDQRVDRALVVEREFGAEPALERAGLEAHLDLARTLRAEVGVADLIRREARLPLVARDGLPRPRRIERARRLARLADRGAQLERLPPLGRPEGEVAQDVGRADLGVELQPEAL